MPKQSRRRKWSHGRVKAQTKQALKAALLTVGQEFDRAERSNGRASNFLAEVGHPRIDALVTEMVNALSGVALNDLRAVGDAKPAIPSEAEVIEMAQAAYDRKPSKA